MNKKSWFFRALFVTFLFFWALYYITPSIMLFTFPSEIRRNLQEAEKQIPSWLPKKLIRLGLDLQGGLHLVMGVDVNKAIQDKTERMGDDIVRDALEKKINITKNFRKGNTDIVVLELEKAEDAPTLIEYIQKQYSVLSSGRPDPKKIEIEFVEAYKKEIKKDAVNQAVTTLRNRIDKYGIAEPLIAVQGEQSIEIQLAGMTDIERVKNDIIGKTAQLEFKMVDDKNDFFAQFQGQVQENIRLQTDSYSGPEGGAVIAHYLEADDKDALIQFLKDKTIPDDRQIVFSKKRIPGELKEVFRTWFVHKKAALTGDYLIDASVQTDPDTGLPHVGIRFDNKGRQLFDNVTRTHVKQRLGIVLDDLLDSAPVIEGRISGGSARITLNSFKSRQEILEDAKALSIVLKAGALPAPVYLQEERAVGATLGDQSVDSSKIALFLGAIIIFIFMVMYYNASGIVADVALALNVMLIFGVLASFEATLTLPGMAGIVLTIGMAVDANIIIFERIREELDLGKPVRAAIDAGYSRAMSAILDSNITTFIAGLVLSQYATGPVRGFANTLMIGLVTTTFTAVVVTRLIYDIWGSKNPFKTLSI